jgi:uncharacterized pyridoxal phosphate-containing UPF0001 family protein
MNQVLIRPGIAHGYAVLSESAIIHYKSSIYYGDSAQIGVHWQSNEIVNHWPDQNWQLSERDSSFKLLKEISKQAVKNNRTIQCLLQVHIAQEESKFGFTPAELLEQSSSFNPQDYAGVELCGLMGMASFSDDQQLVRSEFQHLKSTFDALQSGAFNSLQSFRQLSMGMSGDWKMAIEEGSTMIRVGSSIFGSRN